MHITENRAKIVEIVTKTESIVTSPLFVDFKPTMKAKMRLLADAMENADTSQSSADIAKRVIEKLGPMIDQIESICTSIVEISALLTQADASGELDFDSDDALKNARRLDDAVESFISQRQAIMRDTDTLILAVVPIDNVRPC